MNFKIDKIYQVGSGCDIWQLSSSKHNYFEQLLKTDNQLCYIYDKQHHILMLVGIGEHIIGLFYLLRHYYGLNYLKESDIKKYQHIINNNFIIKGAWQPSNIYVENMKFDQDYLSEFELID